MSGFCLDVLIWGGVMQVRYIVCMHGTWCMHHVGIISGVFSFLLYIDKEKRSSCFYFITTYKNLKYFHTSRKWHLIAFFSKSLSPVKWNYEIHDKKMLAIIHALEEWWHYIEGSPCQFEVWMDHKNLKYFHTSKKLNQWQAQWSLHLSQFDFMFHHHPGHSMGKSDALSHHADHGSRSGDNADMTILPPSLLRIGALKGMTTTRAEAEVLWDIWREFCDGEKEESVLKAVEKLQKGHSKLVWVAERLEYKGVLHFYGKIYVPDGKDLCWWIVSQHHDTWVAGHTGRWKTLELVAQNYWWPQMSHYIGQYMKTCNLCLSGPKHSSTHLLENYFCSLFWNPTRTPLVLTS